MPSHSKIVIQEIQHQLARKGFDPGPVDGIWGRMTESAVRRFQAAHNLLVDGIVGPHTSKALFDDVPKVAPADDPAIPWFQEARRLIGVSEDVGPNSSPVIIDWAKKAGIDYRDDDVPWCGLFVAHCVSATLSTEKLPGNPLGARQWLKFGAPCDEVLGSILVFWRIRPNGDKGHVGFYAGEDEDAFHVLGGNQGNKVCITRVERERLLGARWPATAPILDAGKIKLAMGDTFFSKNEA
jgi:uncharacterized protein (TIGR02594 family)